MSKRGRLFVISAPSGSGKTTVINALLRVEPNSVRSVSMTTRSPRTGERNGRDYYFVSRRRFKTAQRQGQLLESARILAHWYGTPRRPIKQALARGKNVLLGVDIQGARKIRESRLPTTLIFLLPPSLSVLKERLERRGTETPREIRARLALARKELAQVQQFDYAVANVRLKEAIAAIRVIFKAQRYRVYL